MNLYFKIINDHIHHDMSRPPVSDSLNHLTAVFEFDEVWEGCTKTAVFTDKNTAYTVLLEEDSCIIPHEVLQGKYFTVSVYGTKDDTRITATELMIPLDKSGYREGETPQEPTLTVYEQILGELERIKGESEVPDGGITTEKIADYAITKAKLASDVWVQFDSADEIGYLKGEIELLNNTKSDKPTITSSLPEPELELVHNTETRYGEPTTLTLTLPETVSDDYISSIIFTSGATATALTHPEEIIFTGDDCIDGVFTPIENKRYEVIVWYDGSIFKGIVRGDGI